MNEIKLEQLRRVPTAYEQIPYEQGVLLFDYDNFTIAKIGEIHSRILAVLNGENEHILGQYSLQDLEKAISALNALMERGIAFKDNDCHLHYQNGGTSFTHAEISFPTVHKCNLQCSYCFAGAGQKYASTHQERVVNGDLIEKALRYLVYQFAPNVQYYRIDFVSGGEPLLDVDTIRLTFHHAAALAEEIHKPINIWICTNGTCLHQQARNLLGEMNASFGISLDGDKQIHDPVRSFRDGTGTYETIWKNIQWIREDQQLAQKTKDFWILGVLHKRNLDVSRILRHHQDRGFRTVQLTLARLPSNHELALNNNDIDQLISHYSTLRDTLITQISGGHLELLKMILNDRDCLGRIIAQLLTKQKLIYRCGAGKFKMSVAANGDIYPCDSFVGEPAFLLDNLNHPRKSNVANSFFDAHVFNRYPCSTCWNRYLCGGDCYYNSYVTKGDIHAIEVDFCRLKKHLSACAIAIVYQLSRNKKQLYYMISYIKRRIAVSVN